MNFELPHHSVWREIIYKISEGKSDDLKFNSCSKLLRDMAQKCNNSFVFNATEIFLNDRYVYLSWNSIKIK